ncbi:DeoR/GlpR family transcriptional regulator of sugar metabolism [Arthrobacter sp. SLBN-112]|nr:DeoR/GlpR family transcriptional regulator of sugar metabolism [Arthrobacter sp. SLBN-112]
MLTSALRKIVVLHSSKFDRSGIACVGSLSEIGEPVSDDNVSAQLRDDLLSDGVTVHIG